MTWEKFQGTGASWFSISMLGWYLLIIQIFSTAGVNLPLPVGDLSHSGTRMQALPRAKYEEGWDGIRIGK
jgi:hypothetical protein